MNYEDWINEAKETINRLPIGTIFVLRDLFEGCKWNALPKGERLKFGGYFKRQVENKTVCYVEYVGKAQNNSAQYKRIER